MKDLQGSASTPVTASPEQCVTLLAAIDRYPTWYPDVIREVEVLERDSQGVPVRARTTVHLAIGPLSNDFRFIVAVEARPDSVVLTRVPDSPSDPERLEVRWRVQPRRLDVDVAARLDVPRFLPVGGAGDSVAQGFADAAKRVLDGRGPAVSS
jgi:ribosome-associated toxin RatA of RatAB toxin-antitoxin module